jgi:GntR family transcriptional regulator
LTPHETAGLEPTKTAEGLTKNSKEHGSMSETPARGQGSTAAQRADIAPQRTSRATRTLTAQLPPYRRIAEDLRARIDSGDLAPGDQVPSENELIATYGVARATVRNAIAALRASGLVITSRGKGTTVRESTPAGSGASGILTFDPKVVRPRRGQKAASARFHTWDEQDWVDVEEPSRYRTDAGRYAAALDLQASEPIFVLERHLLHSTGAHATHRVFVPFRTVDQVPSLEADPFLPLADLYRAITAAGHELHWRDAITATMPTPDDAVAMNIPDGVPLLVHTRTTCDENGQALVLEETRLPADRTVLTPPPPI